MNQTNKKHTKHMVVAPDSAEADLYSVDCRSDIGVSQEGSDETLQAEIRQDLVDAICL